MTNEQNKCCEKCDVNTAPYSISRARTPNVRGCLVPDCPCHQNPQPAPKEQEWEGWEVWKANFCQHIDNWSYFSADEELERMKLALLTRHTDKARREDAALVEDLHDFHKPEDDPWNKAIQAATARLTHPVETKDH